MFIREINASLVCSPSLPPSHACYHVLINGAVGLCVSCSKFLLTTWLMISPFREDNAKNQETDRLRIPLIPLLIVTGVG